MARLLYNDRAGLQQVLVLDPDRQQFVLGRQSDCDVIVHDTSVSRRHCIIVPEGDGGFAVVDLGSANGTLVNDVRVTRRRLADRDVIRCGIYAVRFIDEAATAEQAQVTLRDRYRRRAGDNSLRASVDRLQAINESQAERLVQLQDAFTRVDAERTEVRRQAAEMQEHLRHLAAAIQHLERENATLRSSSAGQISAPPPTPPPPIEAAPLANVGLAAENQALRAAVAQLEGSLAAEDAFVKAARLVPAVDRWRQVSTARARPAQDRVGAAGAPEAIWSEGVDQQAARLRGSLTAAEARVSELEADRAALRGALTQARRSLSEAQGRLESKRSLVLRPAAAFGPPAPSSGLPQASRLGRGVARTGPLLSALGGLGQTAATASHGKVGAAGQGPGEGSNRHLGQMDEPADADHGRARPGAGGQQQARHDAERLCQRLETYRGDAGSGGITARELAEFADLAARIRDALT